MVAKCAYVWENAVEPVPVLRQNMKCYREKQNFQTRGFLPYSLMLNSTSQSFIFYLISHDLTPCFAYLVVSVVCGSSAKFEVPKLK